MNREHTHQEINWSSITKYVDLDTGEQITEKDAKRAYVIVKTKKHSHVTRSTGITEYTHECRRSRQMDLFEPAKGK